MIKVAHYVNLRKTNKTDRPFEMTKIAKIRKKNVYNIK